MKAATAASRALGERFLVSKQEHHATYGIWDAVSSQDMEVHVDVREVLIPFGGTGISGPRHDGIMGSLFDALGGA